MVFPEYSRSPEARYPVANEQSYSVAKWVVEQGRDNGLDGTRLAIAGDSVGGNMAIALTLMAKERRDVNFAGQVLFYPVIRHLVVSRIRRRVLAYPNRDAVVLESVHDE
ncbi:hypothetical protein GCM10027169_11290 [Gordonia jinhuaensis]|uniref:Alpha/beta hydrolase fold-3 domain-containing protein n=1 Tax=Gordonia jinhuaensis TaxID=1517702 RepID=A0A916WSR6_9ACTN|nr:hypothetical protein GCM10011489_19220 [Gordonia jinhuaensis]